MQSLLEKPCAEKKMARIGATKTELVWPGKYNEDGARKEVPRVSLPFQGIEPANESRALRHRGRSLFGKGIFQRFISVGGGGHSSCAERRVRSVAANHKPEK